MKGLLMVLCLSVSLTVFCQETKKMVADETTLTDLVKSVKIETVNEEIYGKLITEEVNALKYVTIHYLPSRKYVLYFKPEEREALMKFFEKLNKKAK